MAEQKNTSISTRLVTCKNKLSCTSRWVLELEVACLVINTKHQYPKGGKGAEFYVRRANV